MSAETVIWHDLECGSYAADLPLWLALAAAAEGPVLDVGAGTGRVALVLAAAGHAVIALERDPALAAELERRAGGLPIEVRRADACAFTLERTLALCIVPMQTIHLLADLDGFLSCAAGALREGGLLAVALLGEGVVPFELELDADVLERDGTRFESTPVALRRGGGIVVLERRHSVAGRSVIARTQLTELSEAALQASAARHGLLAEDTRRIAPTTEHAGSAVVLLRRSARG